ncbi:hypothetical protein REPUB_Repub05bG0055500 [Reevesia pubescens]
MRRNLRREIRELLDGNGTMELVNSQLSVSDNGIQKRNSLYWSEADATLQLSTALGLKFVNSDEQMRDRFIELEAEDRDADGLGRGEKRRAVRCLVVKQKPDVVLLQETKLQKVDQRIIRALCDSKDADFACSGSNGTAGGLISIWKEDFFVLSSKIVDSRFILLIGEIKSLNLTCGIGNVYAPNDDGERARFWEEFASILGCYDVPWILGGDFNVVRFPHEKKGLVLNQGPMNLFSEFIENLDFVDLPVTGGYFTWSSNRADPYFCKLDRFLLAIIFLDKVPSLSQKILPNSISDHNPVLVCEDSVDWGPKPFRYFSHWHSIEGFNELVKSAWGRITSDFSNRGNLWRCLNNLKHVIKVWHNRKGVSDFDAIRGLEEEIDKLEKNLQQGSSSDMCRNEWAAKKQTLWVMYRNEERSWLQKSRLKWALEGDRNTKFFHLTASARRRINRIDRLQFFGRVVDTPSELKDLTVRQFELHFNQVSTSSLESFDCDFKVLKDQSILPTQYLGLPLGFNYNSVALWQPVIEKFEKRLVSWKSSLLSIAGRLTLIKAVLCSLPIYFMSIFQAPITVINKLEKIQRRFLWGGSTPNKKPHMVDWSSVCTLKKFGGLGLVKLNLINRALLNKWVWRYSKEQNSLWKLVIDSKYGDTVSTLLPSMKKARYFSSSWRNIMRPVLKSCPFSTFLLSNMGSLLGDGKRIKFWSDEWIDGHVLKVLKGKVAVKDELARRRIFHDNSLALPAGQSTEVWRMVFLAIIWSIWLCRNDMIFNGKFLDTHQLLDLTKYRLATWFKAKWPAAAFSFVDAFGSELSGGHRSCCVATVPGCFLPWVLLSARFFWLSTVARSRRARLRIADFTPLFWPFWSSWVGGSSTAVVFAGSSFVEL